MVRDIQAILDEALRVRPSAVVTVDVDVEGMVL